MLISEAGSLLLAAQSNFLKQSLLLTSFALKSQFSYIHNNIKDLKESAKTAKSWTNIYPNLVILYLISKLS